MDLYTTTTYQASQKVLSRYSSSFSLASCFFPHPVRQDISALYAVVRTADEIVDGTAASYQLKESDILSTLNSFQEDLFQALDHGFSTNPFLHAFSSTARRVHIKKEHINAFFASMRSDCDPGISDEESLSLEEYIYGSAEVIGLMCLSIFRTNYPQHFQKHSLSEQDTLYNSARSLGSAFQKINFLRDFHEDHYRLQRNYLPVARAGSLSNQEKEEIIADIRHDLSNAQLGIPLLPYRVQIAILSAYNLFSLLTHRLETMSTEKIAHTRIRIPTPHKIIILLRSAFSVTKTMWFRSRGHHSREHH